MEKQIAERNQLREFAPKFAELNDAKKHGITKEEHGGMFGLGEKIASFYGDTDVKVKNYGIEKAFYDRYDVNELLKENRITKEQIVEDVEKMITTMLF